MLPRLLPWLYRLADEDNHSVQSRFPFTSRQELLQALASIKSHESSEEEEKYTTLCETLEAVWGPIAPQAARDHTGRGDSGLRPAAPGRPDTPTDQGQAARGDADVGQSIASLQELKASLDSIF